VAKDCWLGASTAPVLGQAAHWSLRRLESADFTTEVSLDKGDGQISVEAVDERGEYRNFLNLQTVVVSPKGERQTVRLEQTGPGRYERVSNEGGRLLFAEPDGSEGGQARGSQVVGASVNYSPEFSAPEPNLHLLNRWRKPGAASG